MDPSAHKPFHRFTTPAIVEVSWDPVRKAHTPFRASLRHKHSTWARTASSRPELYLQPESVEEIRLIVDLARRLGKHIVVVGSGHSPSDLTCTSSWMVNLDNFRAVVAEDADSRVITVQAGIRVYMMVRELEKRGWAMPNLGSITEQSIAGAIATSTHGSSLQHGILSESVVSLSVMLANGKVVECSKDKNTDLFRAALVSLGAIGIVTHVGFQAVPAFKVRWDQEVVTLPRFLKSFDHVWTESEFVRCWWFPYSERTILWHGKKVDEEIQEPPKSWYGAMVGRYTYEFLLYVAAWFPSLMPRVERFVFSMQYGWDEGVKGSAVQNSHEALTMDCLFSQLVNEVCRLLRAPRVWFANPATVVDSASQRARGDHPSPALAHRKRGALRHPDLFQGHLRARPNRGPSNRLLTQYQPAGLARPKHRRRPNSVPQRDSVPSLPQDGGALGALLPGLRVPHEGPGRKAALGQELCDADGERLLEHVSRHGELGQAERAGGSH